MADSNPTIAEMQAGLSQAASIFQGYSGAKKLHDALANAEQVGRELDAANAKKRAELTANCDATIEAAKIEAQKQTHAILARAKEDAGRIVSEAAARANQSDEALKGAAAELATLQDKLVELKKHAASLAG